MTKPRFQAATSDHDRRHVARFNPRRVVTESPRDRVTVRGVLTAFIVGAALAAAVTFGVAL
ncbi:MAG: hypothetical protein HC888_16120 [Candidatus Competibacteraceae bacterium]|nr:hypothetical protein [Candidatus Competibacteraceae bacterium]